MKVYLTSAYYGDCTHIFSTRELAEQYINNYKSVYRCNTFPTFEATVTEFDVDSENDIVTPKYYQYLATVDISGGKHKIFLNIAVTPSNEEINRVVKARSYATNNQVDMVNVEMSYEVRVSIDRLDDDMAKEKAIAILKDYLINLVDKSNRKGFEDKGIVDEN